MSHLVLINRIKRFFRSMKFWVGLALLSLPLAGFMAGKGRGLRPESPEIVIDTTEVECECAQTAAIETLEGESNAVNESAAETQKKETTELMADQGAAAGAENFLFVASKNGEKYYPLDCGLVARIKEENRVYYESEEEAIDDGKERASGCK